jgi:hypothetical protein
MVESKKEVNALRLVMKIKSNSKVKCHHIRCGFFNAAGSRVKQKGAYVVLTSHPDPQAHGGGFLKQEKNSIAFLFLF